MKILIVALFSITLSSCAQTDVQEINKTNSPFVALAPLRFLASDELMGRGTMRPEINIAARYISEEFRSMNLKEVPGTKDYIQPFTIKMFTASNSGSLIVNNKTYDIGAGMLQLNGLDISLNAPIVYARFGMKEDLDKINVSGKIVVIEWGATDSTSFSEGFDFIQTKVKLVRERGAVALIERSHRDASWKSIQSFLMKEHTQWLDDAGDFGVFIVNDKDSFLPALTQTQSVNATLSAKGNLEKSIAAKNVMGWVAGTDVKLKDQFIVLSSHYDHLGVAKHPKTEEGKLDSIYNGARDNAIGTAAVIDAARYFSQHPAKRPILFIAFTAEELGLIGSKYFATHPPLPMKQLVYNLNIDNASYNDTTIITLVGLGRTSADTDIKKACAAYNLSVLPDPTDGQFLFDGSDNASLAEKGIPAPTFSLGMKTFDLTIFNRYHQLSDEVGNFNLNYAMKFINSFILAAKYIADNDKQPIWMKGDKYEAAWQALYH